MHAPPQQHHQPLPPAFRNLPPLAPPVHSATAASAGATQDGAQTKKGGKAKDLSHVPCKFFKANSCTAGKACPFSHDLTAPGTNKPVCQWFAKGNCKFGHKCALAHVLPGQPLSFDRKNKRAAQQALREAQANGQENGGLVTPTNVTAQAPLAVDGHGLVRTLRQSVDYGRAGEYVSAGFIVGPGPVIGGGASSSGASHNGSVDAMFGSPDSLGHRTPASSPPMQHRTLPHSETPHPPLSFATLSQGPTATFITPTPSGLSHHFGTSSASNGRGSVAVQAMLSEQARRLSSTSGGDPLSPPRVAQLTRARMSFNGALPATDFPSSPPLAVPVALPGGSSANGGGQAGGIFGTSPFSGSRGLFIPNSYDSNEDAFPRSPPARAAGLPHEMVRQNSNGPNGGWTIQGLAAAEEAIVDDDDDFADEAFLPSSLNDLLTPEEMRRRTLRAFSHGLHGPSSLSKDSSLLASAGGSSVGDAFSSLHNNSKSVPADLLLSHGQPALPPSLALAAGVPPPSLGPRSSSATAAPGWGILSSSVEGHNPSALPYEPPTRSLLSQSRTAASVTSTTSTTASPILSSSASTLDGVSVDRPTYASSLLSATLTNGGANGSTNGRPTVNPLGPGVYSASFNDAAALHGQHPSLAAFSFNPTPAQPQPRYPQSGLSPNTNASLAAPGSSLPGGLAAGLSRLHLVPPAHTGETPPSSSASLLTSYAAAAASPPSTSRAGPAPGSALARRMSSTTTGSTAAGGARETVGSPLKDQLLVPPTFGRTLTNGSEGAVSSSGASAGGEEREELEEDGGEEIQFDMEVA